MTKHDPLTPEELETQRHNLAFFKGGVDALDAALNVIVDIDFDDSIYTKISSVISSLKKEYTDAIKAIEESQDMTDQTLLKTCVQDILNVDFDINSEQEPLNIKTFPSFIPSGALLVSGILHDGTIITCIPISPKGTLEIQERPKGIVTKILFKSPEQDLEYNYGVSL